MENCHLNRETYVRSFIMLEPKVQKHGKKEQRQNFSIPIDLTRRCYQLLSESSVIVKDINAINFTFVTAPLD